MSQYSDMLIQSMLMQRGGMTPGQAIMQGTGQIAAALQARREKAELQRNNQLQQELAAKLTGGDPRALQMALANPQAVQNNPLLQELLMQQMQPQKRDIRNVGNQLVEVGPQGANPIYTAPEKANEPTIVDQVRAAGFDPQSPEGQAFARQILLKPGVNIDMSDKYGPVPAGFRRVTDPNSPTRSRIVPEPGGPADQEYNKQLKDLDDTESAFGLLVEAMNDVGKMEGALTGEGRGRLGAAYGNARSAIRTLYNTGVLQPGELPMLEEALKNPNAVSALIDPRSRRTLGAQIAELNKLLNSKKQNLARQYDKPIPGLDDDLTPEERAELDNLRRRRGG